MRKLSLENTENKDPNQSKIEALTPASNRYKAAQTVEHVL